MGVSCRLMSGGVALEEAEIPLEANGQASWFIEEAFPTTDTSDFLGSVRCTVLGSRRFTAIAVEMDAAERIFNTLSVVPVDRTGGGNKQTTLDFAHFANGIWITDLVFVNLSTEASRPAPTPFHTDILPSRPAIYFYDTEGNPIAADSVVDITGDLEITEDGALTVRTEMEPLGVLTISTHGRGSWCRDRCGWSRTVPSAGCSALSTRHRRGRGGGWPARRRRPLPGAPPRGRNHHRGCDPQPGIESGAGALRLDAGGCATRRRESPPGGQTGKRPGSSTSRSPPPIRPTSWGRCDAMRSGRGGSPPWPWKWTPATASSPRCQWCRSQRCRLRNRRR